MIQLTARQWSRETLLPVVRAMDDEGQLRPEIVASLFDHGYMGMVSTTFHSILVHSA